MQGVNWACSVEGESRLGSQAGIVPRTSLACIWRYGDRTKSHSNSRILITVLSLWFVSIDVWSPWLFLPRSIVSFAVRVDTRVLKDD